MHKESIPEMLWVESVAHRKGRLLELISILSHPSILTLWPFTMRLLGKAVMEFHSPAISPAVQMNGYKQLSSHPSQHLRAPDSLSLPHHIEQHQIVCSG